MQEIRRALRMGCRAENRPLVIPQNLEPALDIGGVIGAGLGCQGQIGAKERCAKLGDQFFAGVAFIAPFLAPEFTVKPVFVLCPVGQLMAKGGVVGLGAPEAFKKRHLHMIAAAAVIGPVAAVPNIRARGAEEFLGMVDPPGGIDDGLGLGVEMLGQSFDLLDIKHAVAFHERIFRSSSLPSSCSSVLVMVLA